MRLASTILGFLLWSVMCSAQQNPQHRLNIGDSIPYSIIQSLLGNASTDTQHITLENKVIILDFWNIWCAACIKSFPKIDSLQQQFSRDLQFVLVTQNTTPQVDNLFKRIQTQRPGVPMINSDSLLNQLFPHQGDPLHVWINKGGRIAFITYGYNATESHISNMLKGEQLQLARRNDANIDYQEPIISETNGFLIKEVQGYSTIAQLFKYTGNTQTVIKKDSLTGQPVFLRVMNASILKLFQIAFGKDLFKTEINVNQLVKNNRLIIQAHNRKSLFAPSDISELDTWRMDNLYSYEIKIPAGSGIDIYRMMQQDLNRYLMINGKLEKRWKNCLILVRNNKSDKMKTINDSDPPSFIYSNDSSIIKNSPLNSTLVKQLIYLNANKDYPIIDETNYSKPVDLTLHSTLYNLKSLRKALSYYGLNLQMARRKIDVLIISDK